MSASNRVTISTWSDQPVAGEERGVLPPRRRPRSAPARKPSIALPLFPTTMARRVSAARAERRRESTERKKTERKAKRDITRSHGHGDDERTGVRGERLGERGGRSVFDELDALAPREHDGQSRAGPGAERSSRTIEPRTRGAIVTGSDREGGGAPSSYGGRSSAVRPPRRRGTPGGIAGPPRSRRPPRRAARRRRSGHRPRWAEHRPDTHPKRTTARPSAPRSPPCRGRSTPRRSAALAPDGTRPSRRAERGRGGKPPIHRARPAPRGADALGPSSFARTSSANASALRRPRAPGAGERDRRRRRELRALRLAAGAAFGMRAHRPRSALGELSVAERNQDVVIRTGHRRSFPSRSLRRASA